MSFATVIKNSVFFFLLVFIIHYMINNVLLERQSIIDLKPKESDANSSDQEVDFNQDKKGINYPMPERALEGQFKTHDKGKDLYNYVFSQNADNELDKYYSVDSGMQQKAALDPEMRCDAQCANRLRTDDKCNSKAIDFCNTTIPTQQEIRGHFSGFNKPECEGDIDQNKHVYLVNNYKDEKLINGGRVEKTFDGSGMTDGGIMAFDGSEPTSFMSY
jgi:hypothetical protein